MVQPLQDGNPLTVQWLNALATEVSNLTDRFAEVSLERTIPSFNGLAADAAASDKLVIETRKETIAINPASVGTDGLKQFETLTKAITWQTAFSSIPVVIASLQAAADISVLTTSVTTSGCNIVLWNNYKDPYKNTTVYVHLLVVGKAS